MKENIWLIDELVIRRELGDILAKQFESMEFDVARMQPNVFRLSGAAHRIFVKWISNEDRLGWNEIRCNQELQASPFFPAPRLLFTRETCAGVFVGWEWAEGTDTRFSQRNKLPIAFSLLWKFHKLHRNNQPVYSLLTTRQYSSIRQMLQADLETLKAGLESAVVTKCAETFTLLANGFATRIHGDVHPGNIRINANSIKFVDWAYSTNSLNLFDLSYVYYHNSGKDRMEWWQITPSEAEAVLSAYYAECGLTKQEWEPLQYAVEVWTALYTRHNAQKANDSQAVENSEQELMNLLASYH